MRSFCNFMLCFALLMNPLLPMIDRWSSAQPPASAHSLIAESAQPPASGAPASEHARLAELWRYPAPSNPATHAPHPARHAGSVTPDAPPLAFTVSENACPDWNGNERTDIGDIQQVANGWGLEIGTPGWVQAFDRNGDGRIDVNDISAVAQRWRRYCLPPDPSIVAPPLDTTVPTTIFTSTVFIYTGEDPIQTGVLSGTIEPQRVTVLRGQVRTRAGEPLSGVTITILDRPEFGQTLTRADGLFDMVINGGGQITVNYEKAGYLPAQRHTQTLWQRYNWLDEAVLIPLDSRVTTVALTDTTPIQVAQGSVISDSDGVRQATLLIPQGTAAEMVLPNGMTQTLSSLNIRATEYTVGENGPETMPGELPPNSGYTYALEYSVDEALAAGATTMRFSQPLIHYVENFLDFDVGTIVPAGYYDREQATWIASENGQVIKILSIAEGLAILDTDGDATPDDGSALGVTPSERQRLATLYQSGQSLWRVPITHFTPWDYNWPYGPPDDAVPPDVGDPTIPGDGDPDDPNQQCGSIIGCETRTLGEVAEIQGTPFRLHYQSDQVIGPPEAHTLHIPLRPITVPFSLNEIVVRIEVAGRLFQYHYPPTNAPPEMTFVWEMPMGA